MWCRTGVFMLVAEGVEPVVRIELTTDGLQNR